MKPLIFLVILYFFLPLQLKVYCKQNNFKFFKNKIDFNDSLFNKIKKVEKNSDCLTKGKLYTKIFEKSKELNYIGIFKVKIFNSDYSSACLILLLQYNENITLLNFNNFNEDFKKLNNFIEKHKIRFIDALLIKTLNDILIFNNKNDASKTGNAP